MSVLFALTVIKTANGAIAHPNVAWLPVTDAELRMSAPLVDKHAGVEALFWRVHLQDETLGQELQRVLYHYVRLKVFTEEGKAKAATVEVEYPLKGAILYVAGRTIKPDGTILELSKDAIHEEVRSRIGALKIQVKSLAMPGVEVGSIVEYRWKEVQQNGVSRYIEMQFQREYPVERVTYFFMPLDRDFAGEQMSMHPFNCQPSPPKLENDGYHSITLENVPAFRGEAMTLGEPNLRKWALVFYHTDDERRDVEKYWAGVSRKTWDELKPLLKANGDLKQAVSETVNGAKEDNDKIVRLIHWVRANIRDVYSADVGDAERAAWYKKLPRDRRRSAVDIFRSGMGSGNEINVLFVAMAEEAGLDARPALIGNRNGTVFNKNLGDVYFLPGIDTAVMSGGKWKIYDVSAKTLDPRMLSWREEGMTALVADPKSLLFVQAPLSPPVDSLISRKATVSLLADGTLEGDVEESWTGHPAEERRAAFAGESESRRLEDMIERLQRAHPRAEITGLRIVDFEKPENALQLAYHVRLPGYAGHTGKRLLFQPLYFQQGIPPLFEAADRQYDIWFHYAWKETDSVRVALPSGFTLESPQNPGSLALGAPGAYTLEMKAGPHLLICNREMVFGNKGMIAYPQKIYAPLKAIFDEIHRRDNQTLVLKQTTTEAQAQ